MTDNTSGPAEAIVGYTATGAGTAAKAVLLDYPWNLTQPSIGQLLLVLFPNGNTAAAMTLAINGNTAVPVKGGDGSVAAIPLIADSALLLFHRGGYLQALGSISNMPTVAALKDAAGNTELAFTTVAGAVNNFNMFNAAAGSAPSMIADGADTDIDANIGAKNGGAVKLRGGGAGSNTKIILAAVSDTNPVNFGTVKSSNTGSAVTWGVGGTDANISINAVPQGTGDFFIKGAAAVHTGGALGTPASGNLANCTFPTLNQNSTGSAAKLTTPRKINGVPFDGTADIVGTPARLIAPAAYVSGGYYNCGPPSNPSTSAALNFGITRTIPWPVAVSLSVAKWFMEFTAAGDAASVFRIGVWNDDGFGRPGTLLLDVGTVSTGTGNAGTVATGGTPGVYEITNALTVAPGLYHIGGAVQGSGTQPSIKTESTNIPFAGCFGTSLPSAGYGAIGYGAGSMAGAFTDATALSLSGSAPRIGFKVA